MPVGLVTGVFLAWWLGRVAYRRLQERGPELLALMRTARHSQPAPETDDEEATEVRYSRTKLVVAIAGWTLGPIAAFPQGLVPMVIKLTDFQLKSWFLPLHLPEPLQWPTAVLMVLIGACLFYLAIKASVPDKETATSDEAGTSETTEAPDSATGPSTLESV